MNRQEHELRLLQAALVKAHDENTRLRKALADAIGRCEDMLMGDDGQAWKETRRAMPRLKAALEVASSHPPPRKVAFQGDPNPPICTRIEGERTPDWKRFPNGWWD